MPRSNRPIRRPPTHYATVNVDGLDIFYREGGSRESPTILLLHGFPSSSHMFRDLIPALADRYHLVAPDYPGFGFSATPAVTAFPYSFDRLADVIDSFADALGLESYLMYLHDFGGPVGFRMAVRRPHRVLGLIVQNANAYEEGMSEIMREFVLPLWPEATTQTLERAGPLFELPATRKQFLEGVPDPSLVSPDGWQLAQWGLDRPAGKNAALALQIDYGSNVVLYDEWQQYFREYQPPTLVAWGKGDFIFTVDGALAYARDLKRIETHLLDTGHFALETHAQEIGTLIADFFGG